MSTLFVYFAFLVRIVFGPFPASGVVAFHYATRLGAVSFLTMLTFSIVLKTLFILDFQRLSLIPEQKVMNCFTAVTVFCSLIYLLQEAAVRHFRGLDHFGRWALNTYLGKVV